MICYSANFYAQNSLNQQSQKIERPVGLQRKILTQTKCKTRNMCPFKQFRSSLNGLTKVAVQDCPQKRKTIFKKSSVRSSHLRQGLYFNNTCNFIGKASLLQVFSCEFCLISKNTFFTGHLPLTASAMCKNVILRTIKKKNNFLRKALKSPLFLQSFLLT